MSNQPVTQPVTLNREQAIELRRALFRLRELQSSAIVTPNTDAEKQGLHQFIAGTVAAHADELLGAWFACKDEYEPLIQGVASLLRRASSINATLAARAAEFARAQAQNAEAPKQAPPLTIVSKDGDK